MTEKKDKREKPLFLDMDFAEALSRFGGVDPVELPDNLKLGKRARQKKKGDAEAPPRKVDRNGG